MIDRTTNQETSDDWADDDFDQEAGFDELVVDDVQGNHGIKLKSVLDVPVSTRIVIGRTKIAIRSLLQMNVGSVVEFDRLATEPMDVLIDGTLIARGEVVVVDDKFGLRLTEIISQAERIKRLI